MKLYNLFSGTDFETIVLSQKEKGKEKWSINMSIVKQ